MKRKWREAMRAAARQRDQQPDDEAVETRDWFEKWATVPGQQEESNNNHRSQE